VKAADPSTTEAPKPPERRERAGRGGTPSIPPVDPATPDGVQPPRNLGTPPGKQRRPLFSRARILAGGGGMVLILLIVVIVVVNSGSTPLPTSLLPAKATILQDNFSSKTHGWTDNGTQRDRAHYDNGTYRVRGSTPNSIFSVAPKKASRVYPSASANLGIKVDARIVPGTVQAEDAEYGIFCRKDQKGNSYGFMIGGTGSGTYVAIEKRFDNGDGYKQVKGIDNATIHLNAYNLLEAQCTNEGQQSVRLVFSVNNQIVAAWTDTDNPLPTGTVGLGVETSKQVNKPVEAEFANLVVTLV
jgi:hypothetical protein